MTYISFFFNDTATTEIYTLSLHDALPILLNPMGHDRRLRRKSMPHHSRTRSEEHTSELQSQFHLVCRLLLEKKIKISNRKSNLSNFSTELQYFQPSP